MPRTSRPLPPLALLVLAQLAAANDVLVVDDDPGPGVDFTTLDAAVAAAADGDVLLVRPGAYASPSPPDLEVSGKSLTIVADGPATFSGSLRVELLTGTQALAVRGLDSSDDFALELASNAGLAWVEDCRLGYQLSGFDTSFTSFFSSSNVVLLRDRFLVGATSASSSSVSAYDCDFEGVTIGHPGSFDAALILNDGSLFASGTRFASTPFFQDIFVNAGSPSIFLLEPDADDLPAGVTFLAGNSGGVARSYQADATVREGQPLTLDVTGVPGDFVFVLVGTQPLEAFLPVYDGSLLVSPTPGVTPPFLGQVPASGTLQATVTMPQLPDGMESRVYFSQAVFFPAPNVPVLGPGSMVVLLDDSL